MLPRAHVRDAGPPIGRIIDEVARDRRGAVTTEYVIVVGTVALLAVGAFVAIGPQLVAAYDHARNVIAVPFP